MGQLARLTPPGIFARGTYCLATLLVLQFVVGCASGSATEKPQDPHSHGTPANSTPRAPVTPEELAFQMGCKPQSRNADFQQEQCQTSAARYVVTTFATDKGQQDWLTAAKPYGGTYLVGTRWVVVTNEPQALEELRHRFGGEIQAGSAHHH